jgi:glucan 1,3-beta-glucosidase
MLDLILILYSLCNAFSYWQGQTSANATASFFDDVMQAFGHIQSVAGSTSKGPELWVGETGKALPIKLT